LFGLQRVPHEPIAFTDVRVILLTHLMNQLLELGDVVVTIMYRLG
jgi:hypothetical protein